MEDVNNLMIMAPCLLGVLLMDHVNRCDTCYLAINQSELCTSGSRTLGRPPPTHLACERALLRPTEELRILSTNCPGFLAWRPAVNAVVSFITARCPSVHLLESAKGLVSPEAAVRIPARFRLGTPEQRRTPCSILVPGRRICQGKGVGLVLFNSIVGSDCTF